MIVVLNEWVFHDLLGENGGGIQRETAGFLNVFFPSPDLLVWPVEPRWIQKANRLMTLADTQLRNTSKQFHTLLRDLDRVIDVRMIDQAAIPQELLTQLPPEDVYLIEAYLSANADVLVTTDHELYESLVDSGLVACELRDEFLAHYLP